MPLNEYPDNTLALHLQNKLSHPTDIASPTSRYECEMSLRDKAKEPGIPIQVQRPETLTEGMVFQPKRPFSRIIRNASVRVECPFGDPAFGPRVADL
jgi:hypothetical protein